MFRFIYLQNLPSTISLRSLAVHKTGVRQDMVLGFLSRNELVHRLISRRHTVGFKRVWMLGASEEHIRCDT